MKKVNWGPPQLQNPNSPYVKNTKTFKEMWKAGQELQAEQEAAQNYLMKAMPAMVALLDYKLRHREPLIVMRPLRYQTSELPESDEVEDNFYKGNSSQERVRDKFKDTIKTILPGTRLMLKSLDMSLQEFVFEDGQGREHALNFCERNNLMTQTSIFEEVKSYLETKGE